MTTTADHTARLRRQETAGVTADDRMTIAEVAERSGVTAHTLRYYERVGLISVGRDESGYRVYTGADFGRIVFLTRLRMTGMPIRDLQRYVRLVEGGEHTVPERLALLEEHRDAVRARIEELAVALDTVERKIATYGGACAG
jgi:DNA-binding transcriptional MerR regulator